ncbi:MAG: DNA alkylation repair protein [Anaerolineae bacterium]|nr:DNA alkylation repair protein [Anaerolineae bacterium]
MSGLSDRIDPAELAATIGADLQALPVVNTATMRAVRRSYSQRLRAEDETYVLALARELNTRRDTRWIAYELIAAHPGAFRSLGAAALEELGQGMDSWDAVDSFARTLSGPAWHAGLVGDDLIHRWAHSEDRWWRRAALVSTVALNMRSHGGRGDVPRTLAVCRLLVADPDDMIVKAMSWALRELVPHEPRALQAFLAENDGVLAARVKHEVNTKLATGLKNPRR